MGSGLKKEWGKGMGQGRGMRVAGAEYLGWRVDEEEGRDEFRGWTEMNRWVICRAVWAVLEMKGKRMLMSLNTVPPFSS